ncbi:MAG: DUF2634 domain-containing protein [Deltaproteobacteria bacterium]|nr:DUF2634 domain-containing protein [Deltaproteobacteria bacterium]
MNDNDLNDLYGQDIKIDFSTMQAVIAANGEAVLTEGTETPIQNILLRLSTPLGSLFYDTGYGSEVYKWVQEENTKANRNGLAAEIKRRIALEPTVVFGSVSARVISWDESGVTVDAGFRLIAEDHPFNLVININDDGKIEGVMNDVNTD